MLQQELENVRDTRYLPNLETIVALNPDLIIGTTAQEQIYAQASQIAPTVLFDIQATGQWQEVLQFVGRATNKMEAVKAVLTEYNRRLEKFRQRLNQPAQAIEVSVVRPYPDYVALSQRGSFSGTILEDAGLSRPPSQQGDSTQQQISQENLSQADGDVLFIWTHGGDSDSRQRALAQLKNDPLWLQLEVVQKGKVYEVNGNHWIGAGPIAANLVIDDLFRYLVEEDELS